MVTRSSGDLRSCPSTAERLFEAAGTVFALLQIMRLRRLTEAEQKRWAEAVSRLEAEYDEINR